MPTTPTNTWTEDVLVPMYPGFEHPELPVRLPASVVYPKGTWLGELSAARGTYAAYDKDNLDGSEVPSLLLKYPCATDANGKITIGTVAGVSSFGETHETVPAFAGGAFKTADCRQSGAGVMDAEGMAALHAHLISGTLADGVIKF